MAIATTATMDLTVDQLVTVSLQSVGLLNPQHSAKPGDLLLGRRLLFMGLAALQNTGIILNARERLTEALTVNQNYVDLDADTLTVEEGAMLVNSDGNESLMQLWSPTMYSELSDKTTPGAPIAYYPELLSTKIWRTYLYPVPDDTQYASIKFWRTRKLRDVDTGSVHLDVRPTFYLHLVKWLGGHLARAKGRRDLALEVLQEAEGERMRAEDNEADKGGGFFEMSSSPWDRW